MCGVSKKPSVQKLWRGKANMQMSWSSPSAASRSFGTNETQQLREGQLVGRMLLQRLATGVKTSEIHAKAYSRHSYAHAQYITLVYVRSCCC